MNERINSFWNALFQREITGKRELLRELIRIVKTKKYISLEESNHPEQLFETMKKYVDGGNLGYFPGDQEFFFRLYQRGKDLDLLEFTKETFKGDRAEFVTPGYVVDYFDQIIQDRKPKTVLIPEAEKMLNGLNKMVGLHKDKQFTLTTQNVLMYEMLQLAFEKDDNVDILHLSIYHPLQLEKLYDTVIATPAFGTKFDREEISPSHLTTDSEGIAAQNLLDVLSEDGTLFEVVPAKLTFATGPMSTLRTWINKHYTVESLYIMPEGTFRPHTAIKTYLLSISRKEKEKIHLGQLEFTNKELVLMDKKELNQLEFKRYEDWRVELLLAEDQEELKRFKQIQRQKVKLGEVAEVFRGKSIMKGDIKPGDTHVLNISNIEAGEVLFDDMDTLDEDERKIRRYELQENDLVMTCRGTVNKVAVFEGASKLVIASANIIVVRFKAGILSHYVKVFLESPVGTTLIKSFQRGTTVMNINPKDISEIEIPLLDIDQQQGIVDQYKQEFEQYKRTVEQASTRWKEQKEIVFDRILSS
jgi:hypothetical protein